MALCVRPLTLVSILCRKSPVTASPFLVSSRGAKAGGAAAPKKGGKGATHGKVKMEVVTDPYKLQEYCCGSNYFLEGEDVKLKEDSEYPDWLWTLDVKRPRPRAHELEPGTIPYYIQLQQEEKEHWRHLVKNKKDPARTRFR